MYGMTHVDVWRAGLVLLSALAACGEPAPPLESTDPITPPTLVAGARVLDRHRGDPAQPSTLMGAVAVVGASGEGDRVGLLVATRTNASPTARGERVFLSDDRGRTWSAPTDVPASSRIHLAHDKTYLVAAEAGNATVRRLDATGATLLASFSIGEEGSAWDLALTADAIAFAAPGRFIAFNTLNDVIAEDRGTREPSGVRLRSADGLTWSAFTRWTSEVCLAELRPEVSLEVVTRCVPRRAWPVAWHRLAAIASPEDGPLGYEDHRTLRLGDASYLLYREGGHAFAVGIAPDASATALGPFDLGTGEPDRLFAYESYGGLLALQRDASALTVAELGPGPTVTRTMTLAPCPCVDAAACQCAELPPAALVPLGGDDILVASNVSDGAGATFVVVRVARADELARPAYVAPDELPFPAVGPGQTALEFMCARATACHPHETLQACVTHWLESRVAAPETEAAYARFLATPAGCDGFRASYPELVLPFEPGCTGGTCDGDIAVVRCVASDVIDCARGGGLCSMASGTAECVVGAPADACSVCAGDVAVRCYGAAHIATDCGALGLACIAPTGVGPLCAAAACPGIDCADDVCTRCPFGPATSWTACRRAALKGVDGGGEAEERCEDWFFAPVANFPPRCLGTTIEYTIAGGPGTGVRYLDCIEAGFATCSEVAGPGGTPLAVCVP